MKVCPRCQKTYSDDNLSFCLEDGAMLMPASSPPIPPDTVYEPRPAQPPPGQSGAQPSWNVAPQPYSMQPPKKSSKTWLWVLLILGGLGLLCGGGGVVLFLIGLSNSGNTATTEYNNGVVNKGNSNNGTTTRTTTGTSDRTSVEKLDLNSWVQENSSYGDTDFADDVLTMSSRKRGYYYALAGTSKQVTVGADAKVSVSNLNNESTNLGYGLVFHSSTTPLQQGYAFLLDAKKKRYRIVHHSPGKEDPVINWTKADAIRDGTQWNTLEVRDKPDTIELYINDKLVNSIKNQYGYPSGVIGLYAADGIKVGFRDMAIVH